VLKDLIIFQKAYDFLKWVHVLAGKYPKAEKFVLAQKTENAALELVSSIVEANFSHDKTASFPRVILALEILRIWVRLGFELRFMSLKQYESGSRSLDEIGRLLGGWNKKTGGADRAAPLSKSA
jgi:hypothetical protein